MDTIPGKMTYTLMGCLSGCVHRGDDTVTEVVYIDPITKQKIIVQETTPICKRLAERIPIRQAIYARAEEMAEQASDRCTSINGKIHAHARAWDKVADEWRKGPCPLWQAEA